MNTVRSAFPGAVFALRHASQRRVYQFTGLLFLFALAAGVSGSDRYGAMLLLMTTVLGIGLSAPSVGRDTLSGRAVLYFQRPVTPVAHYSAQLLVVLGSIAAAVALTAIPVALAPPAGAGAYAWVHPVGAFYWGALLAVIGMAVSTLVRRRAVEIMILLLVVSGYQVLVADALGSEAARELLRWLLIPVDAVFTTWQQWRGGSFTVRPDHAAQLVLYPLAWLAILMLRLRKQDVGAADYQVS